MDIRYLHTCLHADEVRRIVERHASLLDERLSNHDGARHLGVGITYDVRDDIYKATLTLRINGTELCERAESTMRLPALLLAFAALSRKVNQYVSDARTHEELPSARTGDDATDVLTVR